jgi:predicted ATP-grasp superfamily ATP-dependent carboligase
MGYPPAVVFGGLTNALSVVRGLGEIGVEVHAVGPEYSPVRASRYCRSFTVVSGEDPQRQLLSWLRSQAPAGAVLLPCDDDSLELLARRRAELCGIGLRPARANDEALVDMLDKERTYEIARACGVGAPRTVLLRAQADLDRAVAEISMPCALKPVHIHEFARHFRRKVFRIQSESELRAAYVRTSQLGLAMLVTEIVPGPEETYWSYYTYVDEHARKLVDFTKQKMRQYPVGFGGATYHLARWSPAAAEAGRRFVDAAGVRGIACVEFKLDARDQQLKIMECNARVTAADALVRAAGLNLGELAYRDAAGLPVAPQDGFREGVRLWYPVQDTLAFTAMRRSGDLTLWSWVRSLVHRQRFPVFSVADPLPSALGLLRLPGRVKARIGRTSETTSSPDAALS